MYNNFTYPYYKKDSDISQWFKTIIFFIIACVMVFFPIDCSVGYCQGKWTPAFGKVIDKRTEVTYKRDKDGYDHTTTEYRITVDVRGYANEIIISHSDYNNLQVGNQVQVVQRMGGLTGCAYGYGFKNKVTGLPSER